MHSEWHSHRGVDPEEADRHINSLETMAVFLGLESFSDQVSDKHVKILLDKKPRLTF